MSTEEETRLKEAVAFNRSVKLSEARERVCEAAVEWWKSEKALGECFNSERIATAWRAMDELQAAAGQLAELEAADVQRHMVCDLMDEWKVELEGT